MWITSIPRVKKNINSIKIHQTHTPTHLNVSFLACWRLLTINYDCRTVFWSAIGDAFRCASATDVELKQTGVWGEASNKSHAHALSLIRKVQFCNRLLLSLSYNVFHCGRGRQICRYSSWDTSVDIPSNVCDLYDSNCVENSNVDKQK